MSPSRCVVGLLEQCSSMREMKQIHGHAITHGLARFAFISSKLLAFYARSDLRYAHTLFSHIPFPNLFDYNTIITAFSPHYSSLFFIQMLNAAVSPNSRTFSLLLSKSSPSLPFLHQLHSHIIRRGHVSDFYVITSLLAAYSNHGSTRAARRLFDQSPYKNVACWTSLVTGYCNNGLVNDARNLFDAIPERERNDVSYSAMVSGYVKNGCFREGIQLFRELKDRNVKPNNSILASVLSACASVGAFEEGKGIHSYVDQNKSQCYYELELGTALIDFYTKCGCVEPAQRVFGNMKTKDVAAWSAMVLGLAINAKNHEALELFEEMEKVGPRPNAVTFIGVLTACNHKDLFGEALKLFGYMSDKYGIVASIEHYGCVVDVLARSGKIEEALEFIKSMEVEPDGVIWGSLLNGCFLHNNIELGHKVGKHLVELEPGHGGRYVLLSNVYATMGKWEAVLETRKFMKDRGVPAVSGSSFIEIHQTVHKFLVHDNNHHCGSYPAEVYRVLNHLGNKLEDYSKSHEIIVF
ncbi:Pentatricopeptide repeat-containing protein [Glycine soja]